MLGLSIVVLSLELVYRLVALPPDYRERLEAAGPIEPVVAESAPAAPDLTAETLATIEPSAGVAVAPTLPEGLRLTRQLEPQPRRVIARLPGAAELAAGAGTAATPFGTTADPALGAATRPATTTAVGVTATLVTLPVPPRRLAARPPSEAPLVAIIIDDMGYSPAALARLARLPGPLSLAFLPYADATRPILEMAQRGDFELMLHLPMEPQGDANPGPEALMVGLEPAELRRRVRWAIGEVPGAVGVNNHMGSRFSADAPGLEVVMDELRRHGLYFLDSRTNPESLAERAARAAGLPASSRNVFLDHDPDPRAITRQLTLVERVARRQGTVIAIGHPYPTTLAALEAWLPSLERRGFRLARVSEVIAERLCRAGGGPDGCGPGLYLARGDVPIAPQESSRAAP